MPSVLISDKLSQSAIDVFESRGLDVTFKTGMSPEELKDVIGEFDGLAIRSATKVTSDILEAATNLKVVGRAGIGVDNVDIPEATQRGVVVMNTPFGNAITTAEHAISMMMALARRIPQASESTHQGLWEKSKFMGVEVTAKTLGLVGCGNIGSIVADRALGLKMKVIAYDPYLSPERAQDLGVTRVELDELYARADFITLHTPLTDQTRGMIGEDSIKKMKPGVRIINCARGGLIDEAALKQALESGQVAGAALDVFEEEPAKSNPLFGLENLVATPHLGASTTEAQENVAVQVAEQMSDYLLTGAVSNALNVPSISAEDAPKLTPYMTLAEQLGSFAGQITQSGIKGVTIEYLGDVAELNTKPLTAAVLAGLLTPLLDSVNMVNAPAIAKERDITVKEVTSSESGAYHTMVRLEVQTERQVRQVAGTLFGQSAPRIVDVNGVDIEAGLEPHMLFVVNDDKPGFIGALGTTLGQLGVNIASFHLGRPSGGGDAIALVAVDQALSEEVIQAVRHLDHVRQAEPLGF